MAVKLPRKKQLVFASTAAAGQIGKFGSFANGLPEATTDVDDAQSLSNYLQGWFGAVLAGNSPAIEDMNALFYVLSYNLAYQQQTGVAEWSATTEYFIGSMVNDGLGNTYVSRTDNNLNNALTDKTKWKPSTDLSAPVGTIVAYAPGYFTAGSNGGTWTTVGPAANTVAGMNNYLPDNWRVCDGTQLNDAASPIFNGAGRYLPQLTDGRFLRGNTAGGSVGGADTVTLTANNLPVHTHAAGTYATSIGISGSAPSLTGTTTFASSGHTHTIDAVANTFVVQGVTAGGTNKNVNSSSSPGTSFSPVTTAPGGTGSVGISGGSYSTTGSNSVTGSSGNNTTTSSSFGILPTYFNTFYIMRVK